MSPRISFKSSFLDLGIGLLLFMPELVIASGQWVCGPSLIGISSFPPCVSGISKSFCKDSQNTLFYSLSDVSPGMVTGADLSITY